MTFDRFAYLDRLKAAGFSESQARAIADGLDQALRADEIAVSKEDLLAGMRANKIDFMQWMAIIIVAQTTVFMALKLLDR